MTLEEIFQHLSEGELSQIFIGDGPEATPGIQKKDYPVFLRHIKLALTTLYSRFKLREGSVAVDMVSGQTVYVLGEAYAKANPGFEANLLKIERVYDEEGEELPLNIIDDKNSLRTTRANTLVVPADLKASQLKVVYRADHPPIDKYKAAAAPQIVDIELPYTHLQALLYFIASRVMNPIGVAGEYHPGNNWYAKYEKACRDLENQGMEIDTDYTQEERFHRNGWV